MIICHIEILDLCLKVGLFEHLTFYPAHLSTLAGGEFAQLTYAGHLLDRQDHRGEIHNGRKQSQGREESLSTAGTEVDTW